MNSLFSTVLRGPSPEQISRLSQWLEARKATQAAREHCEVESPAANSLEFSWAEIRGDTAAMPLSKVVTPYTECAEAGDILLLSPRLMPNVLRPVYVTAFTTWDQTEGDDELLVVAPYSEIPVPATPGELLTGNENKQLSVLSLWNARTVDRRQLRYAWKVAEMPPDERAAAIEVWLHTAFDEPLRATLAERVGPPVLKQSDPRHEYLAEESATFAHLTNLAWDLSFNEIPETATAEEPARSPAPSPADWIRKQWREMKTFFSGLAGSPLGSATFAAAQSEPPASEFAFHLDDRVVTRLWQNEGGRAILWVMTEDGSLTSLNYETAGGESGSVHLHEERGQYLAEIELKESFATVSKREKPIQRIWQAT